MPSSEIPCSQAEIWAVFHSQNLPTEGAIRWPSQEELERRLAKARYCRSVLTDQNHNNTAPRMTFVERRMVLEIDNRSEAARQLRFNHGLTMRIMTNENEKKNMF